MTHRNAWIPLDLVAAPRTGGRAGRLRPRRQADLRRTAARLPRAAEAEGRPAPRPDDRDQAGRQLRPGRRPRQGGREPPHQGVVGDRPDVNDDAAQGRRAVTGRRWRRHQAVDRRRGQGPRQGRGVRRAGVAEQALVVPAGQAAAAAGGQEPGLAAEPHRPLHPRPAGEGGHRPVARGRPGDADPPADARPDRPAADAGGGRRVPRRTRRPTPTRSWSTGCWRRRTTASAGPGAGSTWPATPTRTATASTPRAPSGSTATGSSTPSTATCRSTSSPIEQLAGDLLPTPTTGPEGRHRASTATRMINQEGGIDLEQFRVESVVDRVNTTGAVWLGLTVGCCQCHDHKFDPITPARVLPALRLLQQLRRADAGDPARPRTRPGASRSARRMAAVAEASSSSSTRRRPTRSSGGSAA